MWPGEFKRVMDREQKQCLKGSYRPDLVPRFSHRRSILVYGFLSEFGKMFYNTGRADAPQVRVGTHTGPPKVEPNAKRLQLIEDSLGEVKELALSVVGMFYFPPFSYKFQVKMIE